MNIDLSGRVALVTGAARGQGLATARLLAKSGAQVVLTDMLDEPRLMEAAELGDAAHYCHHDVADQKSWERAVSSAVEHFGRLDILVNNAGIWHTATLESESIEGFAKALQVNLFGTFHGMRAALPALRASGGGSIVNISSTAALLGATGHTAYGASKWAIRGITKTAALELAADNIRVNAVLPGAIDTAMLDTSDQIKSVVAAKIPLARLGQATDVAAMVTFLASDCAAYITGQEFVVDGGLTAGADPSPKQ
ncbi:SDR family NAD(P)-dependent oxidoreductase [Mycolicibacterium moriokaense]|uniref:3alpha(Or 20beta)-hydroxysteroid dehydrogenase n=1 Tax=Mycolicibacterium moriokaense TaxID=39691 RepID=A0A318HBJ2_9MYCO|nr:glucose 1-dehydrogenase [Mycolicibacterium moriokaense]PXX01647.1 3alpha(or 20beta)-hydroxysteroid dehydrogenase [Mycolicibacterium moriokaense]